jgi:hypothetical protein
MPRVSVGWAVASSTSCYRLERLVWYRYMVIVLLASIYIRMPSASTKENLSLSYVCNFAAVYVKPVFGVMY